MGKITRMERVILIIGIILFIIWLGLIFYTVKNIHAGEEDILLIYLKEVGKGIAEGVISFIFIVGILVLYTIIFTREQITRKKVVMRSLFAKLAVKILIFAFTVYVAINSSKFAYTIFIK